jgi:hypothetical protein
MISTPLFQPASKWLSLPPAVVASLERELHHREGFAPYDALCRWVQSTYRIGIQ